jgi:hypothetical protein
MEIRALLLPVRWIKPLSFDLLALSLQEGSSISQMPCPAASFNGVCQVFYSPK